MQVPIFEAIDADTGIKYKGFFFDYPETTYCFTEDYNKEPYVKLIPCLVTYRMTDWGMPNVPQLVKNIDRSSLRKLGYVDTNEEFYGRNESNDSK